MNTPSQRTIALMKKEGYMTAVAEKFNTFAKVRQDMYKWIDIMAIHSEKREIVGIQTTTASNLAARVAKAVAKREFKTWLLAGGVAEFHGWELKNNDKKTKKTWQCRRLRYTKADLISS